MKHIAIFASGNGSNFEAIVTAVKTGELNANIALLLCDKPGARVISRAEAHGIPVFAFSPKSYPSKEAYETEIRTLLQERNVDFIILAGYMRLIGHTLLDAYLNRIINIHPSLLPLFPGVNAIEQAYESGVCETGVTVHYVDEGMDTGPIIAQCTVAIEKADTLESLKQRIHQVEHMLYIQTLRDLFQD